MNIKKGEKMKNLLIDMLTFPLALGVHLYLKASDKKKVRMNEKKIDKFFKDNPQVRRWNEC